MTTTARRRQAHSRRLTENTTSISARGVDRGKRTIYGVKVLGFESSNGRRYLRQALAAALPMYEGRSVRVDHPTKPGEQRSSADVFGRLRNVRLEPGGLYADLEYLESHPLAERICEAAERMPEQFGLSHNAEGEGETTPDGVYVVSRITEVHSVDIVADPATTRGLFEGCGMYGDDKEKMMEQPEEEPGAAAPAAGEGIKTEIMAAVDAALGGDEGALNKIKDLIKLHMKHHGEPAAEEMDEEDGEGDEEKDTKEGEDDDKKDMEEAEDDDEKDKKESKRVKKPAKPLSAFDAMSLCEQAGVSYDRTLLESLCLASADLRKRLIEREQKRQSKPAQKPKTQTATATVNGTENDEDRGPKSWADLARRLGRKVEA